MLKANISGYQPLEAAKKLCKNLVECLLKSRSKNLLYISRNLVALSS